MDVYEKAIQDSFNNGFEHYKSEFIKQTLNNGVAKSQVCILNLEQISEGNKVTFKAEGETHIPLLKGKDYRLRDFIIDLGKSYGKELKSKSNSAMPTGIFMMSEAWYRKQSKDEEIKSLQDDNGKPISDDVQECLVISGRSVDGTFKNFTYTIIRDNDKIVDLVEIKELESKQIEDNTLVMFYKEIKNQLMN